MVRTGALRLRLAPGEGHGERAGARIAIRAGAAGCARRVPAGRHGPRAARAARPAAHEVPRGLAEQPMRARLALLLLALAPWVFATGASAHDVRPAYLEIVEKADGALDIVWKRTPATSAASFTPLFSTGWTDKHPATSRNAGEALVKTWTVAAPHAPL